jgi:hypothetical protein
LAAAQGSSNRQEWQEEGEDGGVTGEGDDVMMMRGCDDVNCTLRILFASCVGVVFSQRTSVGVQAHSTRISNMFCFDLKSLGLGLRMEKCTFTSA